MTTYVLRNGELVNKADLEYIESKVSKNFTVIKDTPEYRSPLSGKLITSRSQRREEMKVYGVREVDPSECRRAGYKNERFMQKHKLSNERNERRTWI